jgi:hypothetical protein
MIIMLQVRQQLSDESALPGQNPGKRTNERRKIKYLDTGKMKRK